ncbi:MAG: CBS domain-containing protein [Pseudomonadota bacterium]
MFTVYGVTGVTFSGTLEEMDRIHALDRIQSTPKIVRDDSALALELKSTPSQQAAVTAYRRMLPPDIERGPLYHAGHIMQRAVITLSDGDSLAYAWQVLSKNRIHQAPVMDDRSRLVGIVSERDLLTGINIDAGRVVESLSRQVRDVMTSPVIAAAAVTDIRRIAAVMLSHGVAGVPIIDQSSNLVGFISRSDILQAVVTDPPVSLWR